MNFTKTSLVILLLFTTTFFIYGQELVLPEPAIKTAGQAMDKHNCGAPEPTADDIRYTLEVVDPMAAAVDRNAGTTCIGLAIWIIRESDGTGGVSLNDINVAVSYANVHFLTAGIEFYICSVNYIDNSTWYDLEQSEESAMATGNQSFNGVNVYFANTVTTNSGASVCGYARFPNNSVTANRIIMRNDCTNTGSSNGTFVHELGHYFDLYHTHQDTEDGNNEPGAEHVPRSGANSNCSTDGDLLCDTEADPNGSNDISCNFINNGTSTMDIYGNVYTPDIDNIMSYYSDACGGLFTPGQYTRISGGFAARLTHTNYDIDGCAPAVVSDPSGLTATLNNSYGVDLSWTDNSANETGFLIERSTDGGTTFTAISNGAVGPDVTTYTDNDLTANTTYHYRVKASNDDCNHYSATASVAVGLVYCVPTHQSNSCAPSPPSTLGAAIYTFTFGGTLINNPNSGCNGPLSVFTPSFCPVVTAGQTYAFTANFQEGGSGPYYPQYVTIWVDANQDGTFDTPSEMVYQANAVAGSTLSDNLVIPATAVNGKTTLRIRTSTSGYGVLSDPCGNVFFSEAEDYGLDITGGLPVELLSFTGLKEEEGVRLEWKTATEENNDYFIIERSLDGRHFEAIDQVSGAGTSEKIVHYQALDAQPQNGVNYYRLTQVDYDGTKHIEDRIVAIEFTDAVSLAVRPNPVKADYLTLDYTALANGRVDLEIVDMRGRIVKAESLAVGFGNNMLEVNLPQLNAGVYMLRTHQDGTFGVIRFVKSK